MRVSNSSPVTIDTGQPWVTVLSEEAAASPAGFFADTGTSSTGDSCTSAVRCVFFRTAGTAFGTSASPTFSGATALIGVAALHSSNGLAVSTCCANPGCANCSASISSQRRTCPDLMCPTTCTPRRIFTPMPRVAQISNRLISTSPVISPTSSTICGGGSRRIQPIIADR
ncbi:hypothetical protein [Pseudomonas sp. 25 E 4]|nr:hypothetical protein [Pseudomonas sp. 25 E 4]